MAGMAFAEGYIFGILVALRANGSKGLADEFCYFFTIYPMLKGVFLVFFFFGGLMSGSWVAIWKLFIRFIESN